jgi:hypothetical protein
MKTTENDEQKMKPKEAILQCQMTGPSPLLPVTRRNGIDPAATLQQKFAA